MASSYNQIGSLTELIKKLNERGIYDFKTLEDIRRFRNNFNSLLSEIKLKNKEALRQNIVSLETEYKKLSEEVIKETREREEILKKEKAEIPTRISELDNKKSKIMIPIYWFQKKLLIRRRFVLENHFDEEVKKPFYYRINKIDLLKNELEDKKTNTEKWIDSMSEEEITRANFVLSVLVENKFIFYGAEGEERALNELKKLPESYIIINDYCRKFETPMYDRKNDDKIFSIQIDHVVIGPTGIYIIETKNWSQHSVESLDLFSPVKQLKRSSFVMFVILNKAVENGYLNAFNKNWGGRQISPKNYILLMNHKPVEEYQFVKIVTIPEINKHITYGNKIFSEEEVNALVDYLKQN